LRSRRLPETVTPLQPGSDSLGMKYSSGRPWSAPAALKFSCRTPLYPKTAPGKFGLAR